MSSRIIKNTHITYAEEGISVADIKEINIPNTILTDEPIHEEYENAIEITDEIDIEQIKSEIRKEITIENQRERQLLKDNALSEAREEAEKLKRQAVEDGFRKGYEKGINDCLIECEEIKKGALSLIEQAEIATKKYYKDNVDNIIKLAGDMAESITHSIIDLSQENLLMLIKPIIDQNDRNELIVISCPPDNFEFLKASKEQLEICAPNARFVILMDSNLEKNGCIIENENQIIDLQIRKQIDSIIKDIRSLED